jgi:hypothetical protein
VQSQCLKWKTNQPDTEEVMTPTPIRPRYRRLKTPRTAAIAGIIFALLYGTSLVLIRIAIPADLADNGKWLETNSGSVAFALNLVPYAGIAFLWFIGVVRDRLGEAEDRFFSTVFLGSGLLFLALTFVGAALAGGLLVSYATENGNLFSSGIFSYNRAVMYNIINVYALRMAGVFMISLGTIWLRTGLMHRGWAIITYTLALVLLVSITHFLWVTLVFPGWVLAVSLYFLILIMRDHSQETEDEA